jgi:hypothetical protein
MGDTTSSKTMFWSAAGEKTLSNWYVLLLSAFAPMESSTVEPLMPLVVTTTPLFSRTSRSLRPRHRTTTLIFVSSLSVSNSRSLRLSGDDRGALEEATDSARDVRPSSMGVAERPRDERCGRDIGGRIVDTVRLTCGGPGRGSPDMAASCVRGRGKAGGSDVGLRSVFMPRNNSGTIVYLWRANDAGTIGSGLGQALPSPALLRELRNILTPLNRCAHSNPY